MELRTHGPWRAALLQYYIPVWWIWWYRNVVWSRKQEAGWRVRKVIYTVT